MPQYLLCGLVTYTTAGNRNTALAAIQTIIDANPQLIATASAAYPAGLNTSGSAALTFSYLVPTGALADSINAGIVSGWNAAPRTTMHASMTLVTP